MAGAPQPQRRRRRPLPNETLVPAGFEAVSHPCFMALRREIPLDDGEMEKRRAEFGAPWEASDEAIGAGKQGQPPPPPQPPPSAAEPAAREKRLREAEQEQEQEEDADLLECCICQEDTMRDPVTCCVKGCYHSYCRECIRRWLQISQRCALCKEPVTWLLGFSSSSAAAPASSSHSSNSGSSLRYSLIAVGPDQAELERQPFPAPNLLQEARAKQLRLHRDMERWRRRQQERQGGVGGGGRGEEQSKEKEEGSSKRMKERRRHEERPAAGEEVKGQSAAAILEGQLARLDREIERESRKLLGKGTTKV